MQTSWLVVDTKQIQVDAAGVIDTSGTAQPDTTGGVDTLSGGGSHIIVHTCTHQSLCINEIVYICQWLAIFY